MVAGIISNELDMTLSPQCKRFQAKQRKEKKGKTVDSA
jgi:hypothetical protein